MAKYPKTIGKCIDLAFTMREERLNVERQVEVLKKQEEELKQHLLQSFGAAKISGARGTLCSASITEKDVPAKSVDWDALYTHVQKTGEFDLLHKRIGEEACQSRWELGHAVPGVEKFHVVKLNITKIK